VVSKHGASTDGRQTDEEPREYGQGRPCTVYMAGAEPKGHPGAQTPGRDGRPSLACASDDDLGNNTTLAPRQLETYISRRRLKTQDEKTTDVVRVLYANEKTTTTTTWQYYYSALSAPDLCVLKRSLLVRSIHFRSFVFSAARLLSYGTVSCYLTHNP